MNQLLQFGRHPDADQLSAFVEHALPAHEQQEMLVHLAACPDCRAIVTLSLPAVEEEVTPLPVRKRWFSGWNLAWAAVPACAALALVLAYVYVGSRSGEPASHPIQMAESRSPAPVGLADGPVAEALKKPQGATKRSFPLQADSVVAVKSKPQPISRAPGPFLFAPQIDNATKSFTIDGAPGATGGVASASLAIQLPIVSMVSKDHRRLALDSRNALFLSNDDGGHWTAVSPSWQGRVMKVALTSPPTSAQVVTTGRNLAPLKKMRTLPSSAFRETLASSALSGVVTDVSGASISGVTVTVTDGTAQIQSAETDRDGHYRIDNLVPGRYQVAAQASGFIKSSVVVDLAPSQQGLADFKLVVGSTSQSVEVTAASPVVSLDAETVPVPFFEITVESGEHWVSADGKSWIRK